MRRQFPIGFNGSSFFIENVVEFGRPELVRLDAKAADVFGFRLDSFMSPSWRDGTGRVSAERWVSRIPEAFLARSGEGVILFDLSNEGPPFAADRIEALHAALDRRGIAPGRCVLLQQNRQLPSAYQAWTQAVGAAPMSMLLYDYFPRRMAGLLAQEGKSYTPYDAARRKKFLCLNFTPKPHRTSLVSWLLAKGFGDEGYISFRPENKNVSSSRLRPSAEFGEADLIDRGLSLLRRSAPLLLDQPREWGESPDFIMPPDHYYADSYFSIVTDSNVNSDVTRFTEKLIKPLAMGHPVLLLGYPRALELLRGFGFETFGEMFDESYDQMICPRARIAAVLVELKRVLSLDLITLHRLYHKMRDKLALNAEIARRALDERYRSSLEESLLLEMINA